MNLRTVISVCVLLAVTTAASAKDSFSCSTELATEITMSSAKINGVATFKKISDVGYGHFYLSEMATEADALKNSGARYAAGTLPSEGGWFSVFVQGLKPGTTYYYMASVIVAGKEKFGEVQTFYTPEKPTRICFTGDVAEVTLSSAKLSGKAFPYPELGNVTFGFIVSKSQNPTLENGFVVSCREMDYDNNFSATAVDLALGTTYYYKAFLESFGIYRSGEVHSFTTPTFSFNTTTLEAESVSKTSVTLKANVEISGSGAEGATAECYFLVSEKFGDLSKSKHIKAEAAEDGSFSAMVSSLNPGYTYYFKAVATVLGKKMEGNIVQFNTKEPEVFTQDVTEIGSFTAIVQGQADYYSNAFYGFYYDRFADTLEAMQSLNNYSIARAEMTSGEDTFHYGLSGLFPETKYYYVAYIKVNNKEYYGEVKSFTTGAWPEYVDMGDGLEWRSWNLGASKPEEFGDYYAWGEVKTKAKYDWDSYKWNTVNWSDCFTKYCFDAIYGNNGYSDNKVVLEKADDAASAKLGGEWRMPTKEEWRVLYSNPDLFYSSDGYYVTVETYNGVQGILVTCIKNNNCLFFPRAGFRNGPAILEQGGGFWYWTSSLSSESVTKAGSSQGPADRNLGLCIRPVRPVKK